MQFNTVFNPTTNGLLHLGHLYMAMVNAAEAHNSGGKFIVRFDDDQFMWTALRGKQGDNIEVEDEIEHDLDWAGIDVDEYNSQQVTRIEVDKMLYYLNKGPLPAQETKATMVELPMTITQTLHDPYPYVPWITARKVVEDFMDGITLKIRGEDLATEYSLYMYFCDIWGLPRPLQWFLPRMFMESGEKLTDLSKTRGNWKIKDFRDHGVSFETVRRSMAQTCLKDPSEPWLIRNIKQHPYLPDGILSE
jgi:glutamyl/glutaminyl-tRNA synthetase